MILKDEAGAIAADIAAGSAKADTLRTFLALTIAVLIETEKPGARSRRAQDKVFTSTSADGLTIANTICAGLPRHDAKRRCSTPAYRRHLRALRYSACMRLPTELL